MTKFSKRLGYSVKEKEITVKEDAPQELREGNFNLLREKTWWDRYFSTTNEEVKSDDLPF